MSYFSTKIFKLQIFVEVKWNRCYTVSNYSNKEAGSMARSYNKLWKLMIDRKMNKTQLRTAAKISSNAMAKLGKDESVPIETLEKYARS